MIDKLRDYIENNGIKRVFVAKELGISPQHLTNILNGHDKVSRKLEEKIAQYLREKGEL